MTANERIDDPRFERDIAYQRYLSCGKTTGRVLLILLGVMAYFTLTIYERSDHEQPRWDTFNEQMASWSRAFPDHPARQFCLLPDDPKPLPPVGSIGLTGRYQLPMVEVEITGILLTLMGPVAIFILSVYFWHYLRLSRQAFRRFRRYWPRGHDMRLFRHPWFYNIRPRKRGWGVVFLLSLELFPVVYLAGLAVYYLEAFMMQSYETDLGADVWDSALRLGVVFVGYTIAMGSIDGYVGIFRVKKYYPVLKRGDSYRRIWKAPARYVVSRWRAYNDTTGD